MHIYYSERFVKPTIALFMFCLITSASSADSINSGQSSNWHDLYMAEAETHSTAGISNKAAPSQRRVNAANDRRAGIAFT
jgi:hypothetical protein